MGMAARLMQKKQSGQQPIDTIGAWRDALAEAFVRLETDAGDADFKGLITQTPEVGGARLSNIQATPHRVQRLAEHLQSDCRDVVFVNLQVAGVALIEQAGHAVSSQPCDLTLTDTRVPYTYSHPRPLQVISFAVPSERLGAALLERRRVALSRSPVGRELAQSLAALARAALSEPSTAAVDLMFHQMIGLVRLACEIDLQPEAPRESHRLQTVLSHIERHFSDPDLTAQSLADAHGISARYVHRLVAPTGRSVAERITARRLEEVARVLVSQGKTSSIAQLAYGAGFRDLSHFNRSFRRRFGATPSEMAARHKSSHPA